MEIVLYIALGLAALVTFLSAIAPTRVEYTEEITIDAPVGDVYDDLRLQEHLMRWSAWPKETKSTCTVEGTDGEVETTLSSSPKGSESAIRRSSASRRMKKWC